jgi:heme/copper-type cytochrome/quinol oxidase subunit 2
MIPASDSVMVESSKIDHEYSKTTFNFSEFKFKTLRVGESAGTFPIHLAAPAIPLDRAQFIYLARLSVILFIIYAVYLFIFVWFLRKFVSGLEKPGFFNNTNAQHLYTLAGLVTLAPLLIWALEALAWPDPYSNYLIDNESAFDTISILPTALLTFGVILFVIAWCFDQGVKLQKEQELTI